MDGSQDAQEGQEAASEGTDVSEDSQAAETTQSANPVYVARVRLLHVPADPNADSAFVEAGEIVPESIAAQWSEAQIIHHIAAGRLAKLDGQE